MDTGKNISKMSIYKCVSLFDQLCLLGLAQSFGLIGMDVKHAFHLHLNWCHNTSAIKEDSRETLQSLCSRDSCFYFCFWLL